MLLLESQMLEPTWGHATSFSQGQIESVTCGCGQKCRQELSVENRKEDKEILYKWQENTGESNKQ